MPPCLASRMLRLPLLETDRSRQRARDQVIASGLLQRSALRLLWATAATRPPVNETRLSGVSLNTALGVPAAAQISSKASSDSSINTIGGVAWPTGGTPPIVKPVAARTNSASARPIGSPTTLSTSFSSTRLTPDATMSTERLLRTVRNMSDFAICGTVQPIADAASAAVRVLASNSRTVNASPRTACTLRAEGADAGFMAERTQDGAPSRKISRICEWSTCPSAPPSHAALADRVDVCNFL
jgi:hypothetical protein